MHHFFREYDVRQLGLFEEFVKWLHKTSKKCIELATTCNDVISLKFKECVCNVIDETVRNSRVMRS